MIKTYCATHFTSLFLALMGLVLVLDIGVPRAASFAAPLAGVILLIAYVIGHGQFLKLRAPEFLFMAAITALAALSALWAFDPGFALERAGKIGVILIPGLFFIEAARQISIGAIPVRYIQTVCVLYALACGVIALEIAWGMRLYRWVNDLPPEHPVYTVFMNRSLVVMTALFLPLVLLMTSLVRCRRTQWALGGLMTVALGAGLIQTESQSAQMFFILSLLMLIVFPANCRFSWIGLGIAIVVLAFVTPWVAQYMFHAFPYDPDVLDNPLMMAASIPHRLEVWNFVATEALKNPLYGQGVEATRFIVSDTWLKLPNTNNMLHPHNAVLQIWVEFGVVGIALASALFVYILRALWRMPTLSRRVALAVLIGMLAVMSTGYGLWQSWQLGLIITLVGLMIVAARAAASTAKQA